jgi:4-carboxymuconolactone decarboxylase
MVSRLVKLTPDALDEAQRRLYDDITGGPRAAGRGTSPLVDAAGGLEGPFNAMLRSPVLGGALQTLGSAVRYRSVLSDRVREMAILAVAAHWDSDFERYAHEMLGRRAGLTEDELAALRAGTVPELDDPVEAAAVTTAVALIGAGDLDDIQYQAAANRLGEPALFELTTLVGYYAMLALQLRVFRVAAPDLS